MGYEGMIYLKEQECDRTMLENKHRQIFNMDVMYNDHHECSFMLKFAHHHKRNKPWRFWKAMHPLCTNHIKILNIHNLHHTEVNFQTQDYEKYFPKEIEALEIEYTEKRIPTKKEMKTLSKVSHRVTDSFGISNVVLNDKTFAQIFQMFAHCKTIVLYDV